MSRASKSDILRRDGRTCAYCGDYVGTNGGGINNATVDHIIPESVCKKTGYPHSGHTYGNLVACCGPCNRRKADRTPEEAGMKLLWQPHANIKRFSKVQEEVWKILESGEGHASEDTSHFAGLLK